MATSSALIDGLAMMCLIGTGFERSSTLPPFAVQSLTTALAAVTPDGVRLFSTKNGTASW